MAVTASATNLGPVMPFKLVHGIASGTGTVSVQTPFTAPDFVLALPKANPNAASWTASSTTAGLVKIVGLSATTAGVMSFLIGEIA